MKATTKSLVSYKWYRKPITHAERELGQYLVKCYDENDNVFRMFIYRNVDVASAYVDELHAAYPNALITIVSEPETQFKWTTRPLAN